MLFSENCDYELLSNIFLKRFLYPASVYNGSAKVYRARTRKPLQTELPRSRHFEQVGEIKVK